MSKFNFRLQKVLDYRETIQDEKMVAYNSTQNKLKMEEQKLIDYQNEIKELLGTRDATSKKTDVYALKHYHAYIEKKYEQINSQRVKVNTVKRDVKEAKKDLIEATKEKMVLEKLKKQYREVFMLDSLKEEEKFVDQIISFKNTME